MNWIVEEDWWGRTARVRTPVADAVVKQLDGHDAIWSLIDDEEVKLQGRCSSFEEAVGQAILAFREVGQAEN